MIDERLTAATNQNRLLHNLQKDPGYIWFIQHMQMHLDTKLRTIIAPPDVAEAALKREYLAGEAMALLMIKDLVGNQILANEDLIGTLKPQETDDG